MVQNDEWGADPSVQMMRKVFKAMERGQEDLLLKLHISPRDSRLKLWREKALYIFEQSWQRGTVTDENKAGVLYIQTLAEIMRADGVCVPEEFLT